jgi:hypothetical protein
MAITKLSVAAVDDFANGREFGAAGPYVRIHGIAEGELDPAATENDVIVDLDRAGRTRAAWSNTRQIFSSCDRPSRGGAAACSSTT